MADRKDKKILVVSENRNYGSLLYALCLSQGLDADRTASLSALLNAEPSAPLNHDVIIYDVPLSQGDNPNVCHAVMASKALKDKCKIFLSPANMHCDDCQNFAAGTCMSMKKPFSSQALVARVKDYIRAASSLDC